MKRGFTLIETFVALTILVLAVMGPLSMLSRAIADGSYAKNQIIAFYLAQEGLELVINQRDTNKLKLPDYDQGLKWLTDLEACFDPVTGVGKYCQIDAKIRLALACGPVQEADGTTSFCEPMKLGNYYSYQNGAGADTIFTRRLKIDLIQALDESGDPLVDDAGDPVYNEAKVTAELTWRDKAHRRNFATRTYLFK